MKLFLLILISIPLYVYGQSDTLKKNYSVDELETAKEHFFIVLDDDNLIKLDSILLFQIDAEWIENITIVKDDKYADILGNTPIRAVLLYPKKKYKKKILTIWELNKDENVND